MIGYATRSSRRVLGGGALVLAVSMLGVGLPGCGSDSGKTSTGNGPAGSPVPAEATGSPGSPREEEPSAAGDSQPGSHNGKSAAAAPRAAAEKPASGDTAARRRAASACPAGLTFSQCEALVEEIKEEKRSGSPPLAKPSDCLENMSRSECEEMLAAQQAAAQQEGSPIHLEECLQHPTPRCRAALEPVLEAQYAASQQAAK